MAHKPHTPMKATDDKRPITKKPKHFVILGNGGGGTSLLRGLLNAHSKCEVRFEDKRSYLEWIAEANNGNGKLWGNKLPIEQFSSMQWDKECIAEISDHFKVVFITRRFHRYYKHRGKLPYYQENWKLAQDLRWAIRERHPDRIVVVSFEDLLLRPEAELRRICAFLDIDYEDSMLSGTLDTGKDDANQKGFNLDKL